MPKGGNSGGGSGGGGTVSVRGTRGDDVFSIPDNAYLYRTFDGRDGVDTLDMSALTSGATVRLNNSISSNSIVSPDRPFTGFYTEWLLTDDPGRLTGTIKSVENLIGGSGDDYLVTANGPGVASTIDAGAGNDFLSASPGATLIGGTGSDVLVSGGSNNILVGGTYAGGVAPGDGEGDLFEVNGNAVILDFEVGLDRIVVSVMSPEDLQARQAVEWTSVVYNGVESAQHTYEGETIILAGVTAEQANSMNLGFYTLIQGVVAGGHGDDIMGSFNGPDTFVFGAESGDDMITQFNTAEDILRFEGEAPVSWVEVSVNGTVALQGVYDGGNSSVTLLGLTAADVQDLMFG